MTISIQYVVAWLTAAGLMAVILTASDKRRTRRGAYRIPERTLWLVAILGGSAAMYITMQGIRHKTKHRRFMWGLPALILLQVVLFGICIIEKWLILG